MVRELAEYARLADRVVRVRNDRSALSLESTRSAASELLRTLVLGLAATHAENSARSAFGPWRPMAEIDRSAARQREALSSMRGMC
jgi:hypothetical protein